MDLVLLFKNSLLLLGIVVVLAFATVLVVGVITGIKDANKKRKVQMAMYDKIIGGLEKAMKEKQK